MKRSLHLDCTSVETAIASLAVLLGSDTNTLRRRIESFDIERFCERNRHHPVPPNEVIFEHVTAGVIPQCPETVTWFHATRVPRSTSFENGIRPLNEMLESIWDQLEQLAADVIDSESWSRFRRRPAGAGAFQYGLKTRNAIHWGPWAFLVRDVVLEARDSWNHDYLSVPEIVEDICQSFQEQFGHDLLDAFRRATCPCLVSFVSDVQRIDTVEAAVNYVYLATRKMELTLDANTCFDAMGRTIPRSEILAIEFLRGYDAGGAL